MIGGATLVMTAPGVAGQPAPGSATANAVSKISVTQSSIVPASECTTPDQALTYQIFSDASIFRLRVRASSPLCSPITATAVVYAMPGDGSVWPQTLAESKSFTISGASVTEIVFTKDCTPAQFDVVTGATPKSISPLGERHGPLLIPDTGTAYQDPGIVCTPASSTTTAPGSSTTSPASTTSSTTSTTAVGNTSVANTTTTVLVQGANTVATTTTPPSVLDTSSTRGSSGGTSPSSLAVTGVSSRATALAGAGLFVAGVGMIIASRRRLVPAVRMITSSSWIDPDSPFGLD